MFKYLNKIIFNKSALIQEVLEGFNETAIHTENSGFAIIIDEVGKCVGVVSDGDIRRKLLEEVSIEAPIEIALNRDFASVLEGDSTHKILRQFDKRITNLPVLNNDGIPVDLYQYSKFMASSRSEQRIIRARVPVRVTYSGGGTDMSSYINDTPAAVLSSTINKYCTASIIIRDDKEGQTSNHIWHWEEGDKQATEEIFKNSDVVLKEKIYIPRIHVASIETCGCVSEFDKATGQLTVWMTTQAPHAIRTVLALVAGHVGLQEDKIRVISPDIGGGFGGKVPVYPGYVIAIAASVVTGLPVKWIEDRRENLQADSFARDYHMDCEIAADKDGTLKGLRIKTLADNGYADAAANPSKYPAGMFSICTGSYNFENAFVEVDGESRTPWMDDIEARGHICATNTAPRSASSARRPRPVVRGTYYCRPSA